MPLSSKCEELRDFLFLFFFFFDKRSIVDVAYCLIVGIKRKVTLNIFVSFLAATKIYLQLSLRIFVFFFSCLSIENELAKKVKIMWNFFFEMEFF
jgi:hypothetical protein